MNSTNDVTEAHLAAITTLRVNASPNQPRSPIQFRIGDFSGLTALTTLEMESMVVLAFQMVPLMS